MELTANEIEKLWKALSPGVALWSLGAASDVTGQAMTAYGPSDMLRRRLYWLGKQTVPGLTGTNRMDGRVKTAARTNWTRYVCDLHAGFLTSHKVNYTLPDGREDAAPIRELMGVYAANLTPALDTGHLVNALLYGYSCEVHGFNGGIKIKMTDPLGWALVYDEAGELALAIYRALLQRGTLWQGQVLMQSRSVYYAYDAQSVRVADPLARGAARMTTTAHYYGRVPVAVFRVNEGRETFFADAFFDACDLYDTIRCSLADDIKYNVDALLQMKGVTIEQLTAKSKTNTADTKTVIERIKEIGIFPVPAGGEVGFISRVVDIEKFQFDLQVSRAAIHLMGCVPDLTPDTVSGNGASTTISGIALKLMFQLMIQKSAEFAAHFEGGLRERVALVNAVWEKRGIAPLTDYDVRVQRNIPQNDIEWAQYMVSLKDVVASRDQLKLLPFIDDPEQAFKNLEEERGAAATKQAEAEARALEIAKAKATTENAGMGTEGNTTTEGAEGADKKRQSMPQTAAGE